MPASTYTYRCGHKTNLLKAEDQYVVRALPEDLARFDLGELEQVSSASTRVTTLPHRLEGQMSMLRHLAPTHHLYLLEETAEHFLITDRVLVTFRAGIALEQIGLFQNKYALQYVAQFSDLDYLFRLTDQTGMNPVKLVQLLTEEEELVSVVDHDLNQQIRKKSISIPADTYYKKQWHLHKRSTDAAFDVRSSSYCEDAWKLLGHFGSQDVVIGISDDGCRMDHVDFDNRKFVNWGYMTGIRLVTATDFDAQISNMYEPGNDHGTAVAGVVAAEVDGRQAVGAAPGCRLIPVKWELNGPYLAISDSKLLTVLNFLADKVDVMSNSWGGSPTSIYADSVLRRIAELGTSGGRRGKGIVFCWAAGNENCPINLNTQIPVPYTPGYNAFGTAWVGVETATRFRQNLTDLNAVMYIGALASTAQRAHYSNYGSGLAVCAPSNNVHSYYRMPVKGLGITTTSGTSNTGVIGNFGGTSSACPLVAGIAGLVISANQSLSALEVISILKKTADKNLNLDAYPRTPPAPYDPDTSWDVSPVSPFADGFFQETGAPEGSWSPWFGHGKVNALEAVREALSRTGHPDQDIKVFNRTVAAGLSIPDYESNGVQSALRVDSNGTLQEIRIQVDLKHTYIGDLLLSVLSPGGKEVVLHDRQGASQTDIQKTYTLENTPALARLSGEQINGQWALLVKDLAPRDVGVLQTWTLSIGYREQNSIQVEEAPGALIPDQDAAGIERSLTVEQSGAIQEIEVSIDISHTYIGDLHVVLTSPANQSVVLHKRTGGNTQNLKQTYTAGNTGGLSSLIGKPMQGVWRLKVSDQAAMDQGKLNRWGIRVEWK